jgi:cytochrome c2
MLVTASLAVGGLPDSGKTPQDPAERGRDTLLHRPLNPAVWSRSAYDNLWKTWGLSEKPKEYDRAVRERYGLHTAPFDNRGLPLGLMESGNFLGKGVVNNCLLCHAGTVAGQTVIGLANSSLDLQSLFDDLSTADGMSLNFPFKFSNVRGTIDPINPATFLMQFRDPDLNIQKPSALGYSEHICSDPPAWWLIKRKQTRDWTGFIDSRSTRVDMVNLLNPMNTAEYIKSQEQTFADISAFLLTVEAPKYPFAIDHALAERGKPIFVENCSKCHGTYGQGGSYPNKVVPLGIIGTDRLLADSMTPRLFENLAKTWFARELDPDGKPIKIVKNNGYQAPPLDGIWATAPYFHNSAVPTVYDVLNSAARPKIHTRSYQTGKEEYDPVKLGWKVTTLKRAPESSAAPLEKRKIYDTSIPGQSNAGHTFGDKLTDAERMAVIEYLKTL